MLPSRVRMNRTVMLDPLDRGISSRNKDHLNQTIPAESVDNLTSRNPLEGEFQSESFKKGKVEK